MSTLYLANSSKTISPWHLFPKERMLQSAVKDIHRVHQLIDDPDAADVILFASNYTYSFLGLEIYSEELFRKFHHKCIVFDSSDVPSPIIGGLCASWSPTLNKIPGMAFGWCYHHPNAAEPVIYHQNFSKTQKYLWSFVGSRTTHSIRDELFKISDPKSCLLDTSKESLPHLSGKTKDTQKQIFIEHYCNIMSESNFIICPRGRGASSMRIFEAMKIGRCPVIISDDWTPPPFVEWEKCSIRISEKELKLLPEILRKNIHKAEQLGAMAQQEWEKVFSPKGLFHYTTEACLTLKNNYALNSNLKKYHQFALIRKSPYRRILLRSIKNICLPTSFSSK